MLLLHHIIRCCTHISKIEASDCEFKKHNFFLRSLIVCKLLKLKIAFLCFCLCANTLVRTNVENLLLKINEVFKISKRRFQSLIRKLFISSEVIVEMERKIYCYSFDRVHYYSITPFAMYTSKFVSIYMTIYDLNAIYDIF